MRGNGLAQHPTAEWNRLSTCFHERDATAADVLVGGAPKCTSPKHVDLSTFWRDYALEASISPFTGHSTIKSLTGRLGKSLKVAREGLDGLVVEIGDPECRQSRHCDDASNHYAGQLVFLFFTVERHKCQLASIAISSSYRS